MHPDLDIFAHTKATVSAPAGCGKTFLVSSTIRRNTTDRPILVLTHTHAGVAALRNRLNATRTSSSQYRLTTLDGWSIRLVRWFPQRACLHPDTLLLHNPRTDYPEIRRGAERVLLSGALDEILPSTYAGLLVDEYQDCSLLQHTLVRLASRLLRTCLLGDPLQAIFGFGGERLPEWADVLHEFPLAGELSIPWRWKNAGKPALGAWLLDVRQRLLRGDAIDLQSAPRDSVSWVELDGTEDEARKARAAYARPPTANGSVLIICNNKPERHKAFAKRVQGASTVDAVDLGDLTKFAATWDPATPLALQELLNLLEPVMTNVGAKDILQRVETIRRGRARKIPSQIEVAALNFVENPTFRAAAVVIGSLGELPGVRTISHAVVSMLLEALTTSQDLASFRTSILQQKERARALGRRVPQRAVSSTLLLKGLESDVAVVVDTDQLTRNQLYVALTRGCSTLIVCSTTRQLSPRP